MNWCGSDEALREYLLDQAKPGKIVWVSQDELRNMSRIVFVRPPLPMQWYLDQLGDA